MSDKQNFDEESFIILGSSPGTSLDMKCNGDMGDFKDDNLAVKCNGIENGCLDKAQIEDAMKDLSLEGSLALKASFNLGDSPSPASMMIASAIITDEKSTEELQKHFGEILDENVVLKETLKQNNDSMKEQFMLIASCQEDMMKTHSLHKEKFEETRELVERLRHENKKLKHDITSLLDANNTSNIVNGETGETKSDPAAVKSGPSSALEFVTSPDDETIDRLTAQLELVEKQRRQVITDNEKLTWQKESLEHIVDATSKERDDLKEKLKNVECMHSAKVAEMTVQLNSMRNAKDEMEKQLKCMNFGPEIEKRDAYIQQCNEKISRLHTDLKNANLKIFELESVKLDFSKYKSEMSEVVRTHRESIHQLGNQLKEASTTTEFQPVRMSASPDPESPELGTLTSHVKLYDRTLKHLAALLNKITAGLSDNLVESIVLILSLNDLTVEKATVDNFRCALETVKQHMETQQNEALANVGQIRGALSIFEGIFNDYKDAVKVLSAAKQETKPTPNMEQLSSALVARGHELQAMENELRKLKNEKEDTEILKAQLDLYKSDFEAERDSRSKMASEKDTIATDLRKTKKLNEELKQQLEEVRRINPTVYKNATASRPASAAHAPLTRMPPNPPHSATGNMVYTCPKCMRFSCEQYKVIEDHFDFCLDDF